MQRRPILRVFCHRGCGNVIKVSTKEELPALCSEWCIGVAGEGGQGVLPIFPSQTSKKE